MRSVRYFKLLVASPAGRGRLYQALLQVGPAAADAIGCTLRLGAPDRLRLDGALLRHARGRQLLLSGGVRGPVVWKVAAAAPIERGTDGRLDVLVSASGWPAPESLWAGRGLLRRLSANDHARLLDAGAAGEVDPAARGVGAVLAHLERDLDGPLVTLG